MRNITQKQALKTYAELAQDVTYSKAMTTGWKPPLKYRRASEEAHQQVRDAFYIICEGSHLPPPIPSFRDMRFPEPILAHLEERGINKPTPIQVGRGGGGARAAGSHPGAGALQRLGCRCRAGCPFPAPLLSTSAEVRHPASAVSSRPLPLQMQGLPVILSGRDMIGIAFTGSGKTLVFSLPMVMAALQEELRMPLAPGEGPCGLIICPSRELARQTLEVVQGLTEVLKKGGPEVSLLPGGMGSPGGGGGAAGGSRYILLAAESGRLAALLPTALTPVPPAPPLLLEMPPPCLLFPLLPGGHPDLRSMVVMGGVDMRTQTEVIRSQGVHMVVATPGRLKDLLSKRRMNLDICRWGGRAGCRVRWCGGRGDEEEQLCVPLGACISPEGTREGASEALPSSLASSL